MKLDEFEDVLMEMKMGPGRLKKDVMALLKSANPVVGVEVEVCFPAESIGGVGIVDIPIIYDSDDLADIKPFFTYNQEEDWNEEEERYNDWVNDKSDEWIESESKESMYYPHRDEDLKIEAMISNYYPDTAAKAIFHEIIGNETVEYDMDIDLAKDVLKHAEEEYERSGAVDEWSTEGMDAYARLYHHMFYVDDSEIEEAFSENFRHRFYEDEYQTFTFGEFLKSKGHKDLRDYFHANDGWIYWPGKGYTENTFDETVANELADRLEEVLPERPDVSLSQGDMAIGSAWMVEPDGSIETRDSEDSGFEVKSPPTPYIEAMQQIEAVFELFNSLGAYTVKETGLHISISIEGIDHNDVDYTKLIVMLGDDEIRRSFKREFNDYCLSTVEKLTDIFDPKTGYERDKLSPKDVAMFMDNMRSDVSQSIQKSFGDEIFNWGRNSIAMRETGYVEFRSMGNEGYLDKLPEIQNNINRFIAAYAVAADPDSYRKQYAKKLYTIARSGLTRGNELPDIPASKDTKVPGMSKGNDKPFEKGSTVSDATLLFAAFGSGMLSKRMLVQKIKHLRSSETDDKYSVLIASAARSTRKENGLTVAEAIAAVTHGVKAEIDDRGKPLDMQPDDLVKLVAKNIEFDPTYYTRPSGTRVTPAQYRELVDIIKSTIINQFTETMPNAMIYKRIKRGIAIEDKKAGKDASITKMQVAKNAYKNLLSDIHFYD